MGTGVTEGQRSLLCMYALRGVVIMYDNDAAGATAAVRSYELLKDKLDTKLVFIQEVDKNGVGLDPADLTKEQVYEYLNTYYNLEDF